MAIGRVLSAAIFNPLFNTLSSRRNFSQGSSANLRRTMFVRVPDRSMTKLLSLSRSWCVAPRSMFAPVTDSVEMIKFVTFATCHVTTKKGSPFSERYPTCLRPMHCSKSKDCRVSVAVEGHRRGFDRRNSRILQRVLRAVQACGHENPLGWSDHVDEPGFRLLRRLTADGTREVHRDDLLHLDGVRHGSYPRSVHSSFAKKAPSRLSPRAR